LDSFEQEMCYGAYEIDFGQRLVAKFHFHPVDFWSSPSFPQVPKEALYPNTDDPVYAMAQELKTDNIP
jgi:hypothetical protein